MVLLCATLAGAIYGRQIQGLWRFGDGIRADSVKAGQRGAEAFELPLTCAQCRNIDGAGVSQAYPRLAAQPEAYLIEQLDAFASGARASPHMAPMALALICRCPFTSRR